MKTAPRPVSPSGKLPQRLLQTYALTCFTKATIDKRYYDPLAYLEKRFAERDSPAKTGESSAPPAGH
jgi:hypothetical protein